MRRHPLCLFLALALVVGLAVSVAEPLAAQDWAGQGRLRGTVKDEAGEPVVGASVKLRFGETDRGPDGLITDKKGRWGYLGLGGGRWAVLIEKDGFIPSEGQVDVSEFGAGANINVVLRPIPEAVEDPALVEAKARLDKGNQLLTAGNAAAARGEYEAALGPLPAENKPAVLLAIARTYYLEDNGAKVIETLEQVLALEPDNADAMNLIIDPLIAAGREEEAKAYQARLPKEMKVDSLLDVGIDHYNAGEFEAAYASFDQLVQEAPENPEGYYYRGLVLLAQQKNAEAKNDFHKHLELSPESSHAAEVQQFLSYLDGGSSK